MKIQKELLDARWQDNPEFLQNPAPTWLPNRASQVPPPDLKAAGSYSKNVWPETLTGSGTTGQPGPARTATPVLIAWRQQAIKEFYSMKHTDKEEGGNSDFTHINVKFWTLQFACCCPAGVLIKWKEERPNGKQHCLLPYDQWDQHRPGRQKSPSSYFLISSGIFLSTTT